MTDGKKQHHESKEVELKDVRMTAVLLPPVFERPNWRTERVSGRIFENLS